MIPPARLETARILSGERKESVEDEQEDGNLDLIKRVEGVMFLHFVAFLVLTRTFGSSFTYSEDYCVFLQICKK